MNAFVEEVMTQGTVLTECLDKHLKGPNAALTEVTSLIRSARYHRILFVGMGSSLAAAPTVADVLSAGGLPSVVLNAYEAGRYQMGQITADTLLVAVSQSGASAEVLDVVRKAKGRTTVVGVVNQEGSPLAKEADIPVFLHAGNEAAISNKSYLNTLAVLNILAAAMLGRLNDDLTSKLYETANWVGAALRQPASPVNAMKSFVQGSLSFDFLAVGPSLSTAAQAALIFREGPRLAAAAVDCADFAHGWKDSARPGYVAVMLDPLGDRGSVQAAMTAEIISKGGKVILLTGAHGVEGNQSLLVVPHPALPEHLAPLVQIIPLDLLMGQLMGGADR